jgi:hypothetical protein
MFCAPRLVFGGIKNVRSSFALLNSFSAVPRRRVLFFHVLRSRIHFWRYRGRRVLFSCFALPNSFSAVSRAPVPVLMFCGVGLILIDIEGLESRIHVFRSRTRFRRSRRRWFPFSYFALPSSFSAVPRASGPVFLFGAPGLIFDGFEGVGSSFHASRSRTRFQRYRRCRIPFSCFALPCSFSVVPKASGPVFHVLRCRTSFRRFRGHRMQFSCFALRNSFSTVSWALGLFFLFCAPDLIFDGSGVVVSSFYVFHTRTRFRPNRGHRVPFSSFALPNLVSAV